MGDDHTAADALLAGADLVARWGFVYDMDEPEGGGFVSGEFLLRADGVLLRRYGWSSLNVASNQTTWRFHAWEPVSWWTGETSPAEAVRILKRHGYDLVQPSPVPIDKQSTRP